MDYDFEFDSYLKHFVITIDGEMIILQSDNESDAMAEAKQIINEWV